MGTATRGRSGASNAGYEEAKQELADAAEDKDAARAAEVYFKAILAAQPNGPAKVPAYLAMRYGAEFVVVSHQQGMEEAAVSVAKTATKDAVAAEASSALVEEASREMAERGVSEGSDEVDRAFSEPAERAMSSAMGDIMTEGADALEQRRNSE
jgi:hypothetical protein